jgi:hypothetical protein
MSATASIPATTSLRQDRGLSSPALLVAESVVEPSKTRIEPVDILFAVFGAGCAPSTKSCFFVCRHILWT